MHTMDKRFILKLISAVMRMKDVADMYPYSQEILRTIKSTNLKLLIVFQTLQVRLAVRPAVICFFGTITIKNSWFLVCFFLVHM